MKLYVHEKGIVLVGKAWQIRAKLKEYNQHYDLLSDWIQNVHKQENS